MDLVELTEGQEVFIYREYRGKGVPTVGKVVSVRRTLVDINLNPEYEGVRPRIATFRRDTQYENTRPNQVPPVIQFRTFEQAEEDRRAEVAWGVLEAHGLQAGFGGRNISAAKLEAIAKILEAEN